MNFSPVLFLGLVLSISVWSTDAAEPRNAASAPNNVSRTAAGDSRAPILSTNEQVIVFLSAANNLVLNDDAEPFVDIFLYDIASSNIALVSVAASGTGGGNDNSYSPSVSGDGQFIVFASAANNLVPGDINEAVDIFLHDRLAGQTVLITHGLGGASSSGPLNLLAPSAALNRHPLISADGRRIVFVSRATNLVVGSDLNNEPDIFVHDRQLGQTELISLNYEATGSAAGASFQAAVTADGRFVAFLSRATNVVADTVPADGLYLRDLTLATTVHASHDIVQILGGSVRCRDPIFSQGGDVLVFSASRPGTELGFLCVYNLANEEATVLATNLLPDTVYAVSDNGRFVVAMVESRELQRFDLATGEVLLLESTLGVVNPAISGDGTRVAYVFGGQVYLKDIPGDDPRQITTSVRNLYQIGGSNNIAPILSADGRKVVFESTASDLVFDDHNMASDIFLYHDDITTNQLVSRALPVRSASTGARLSSLVPGALSSNGQFLIFRSADANMVVPAAQSTPNAFEAVRSLVRRDTVAGTNVAFQGERLVHLPILSGNGAQIIYQSFGRSEESEQIYRGAVASGISVQIAPSLPGGEPRGPARNPSISADGIVVAFEAFATGSLGSDRAVYVYEGTNNQDGRFELISSTLTGTNYPSVHGNGPSSEPVITLDGRWVVFRTLATDLVTNQLPAGVWQLVARDRVTHRTHLLSKDATGRGLPADASVAVIAGDSRTVAFVANNEIYLHRLDTFLTAKVCSDCRAPALDSGGQWLVYQSVEAVPQIYLHNLSSSFVRLVSGNDSGHRGNAPSSNAVVSAGGEYVLFLSAASNLVPGDDNDRVDLFLRESRGGRTVLLTPGRDSLRAKGKLVGEPIICGDGHVAAFQTFLGLTPADYNQTSDIYLVRFQLLDTDGDQLPDEWEMTFFATLDRDGDGDFDQDGQTDRAEFLAGTSPTDEESVLQVIRLLNAGTGELALLWSAVPGKSYRVEFKATAHAAGWTNAGEITADGPTAAFTVPVTNGSAEGYYRVRLLE